MALVWVSVMQRSQGKGFILKMKWRKLRSVLYW